MICKNCGSEVPEGFAFCTNCGAAMSTAQPEAAPAASFFSPAGSLDETPTTEPVTKTAPIAAPTVEPFESPVSEPEVVFGEMPQKPHSKVMGIIALILGIVSLIYPVFQAFGIIGQLANYLSAIIPGLNVIVSTITGCAGCLACGFELFFLIFSPLCAIAGIVLGILAVVSAKKAGCKDSLGTIGLILSIAGPVAMIALFLLSIAITLVYLIITGGAITLTGLLGSIFESADSFSSPSYYDGYYY